MIRVVWRKSPRTSTYFRIHKVFSVNIRIALQIAVKIIGIVLWQRLSVRCSGVTQFHIMPTDDDKLLNDVTIYQERIRLLLFSDIFLCSSSLTFVRALAMIHESCLPLYGNFCDFFAVLLSMFRFNFQTFRTKVHFSISKATHPPLHIRSSAKIVSSISNRNMLFDATKTLQSANRRWAYAGKRMHSDVYTHHIKYAGR